MSVKFGNVNIEKNGTEDEALRNSFVDEIFIGESSVNHKLKLASVYKRVNKAT